DLEANFDQVVAEGRQASADLRKAAALSPEKLAAFLKGKDNPADSIDRRFGQLGLSDCKG
ncbi:MAG: hypothetical protein ACRDZW_00735, partial [Acidimicrobiales bacterium]